MSDSELKPTSRTQVRRLRERGAFDRETINNILDATPLCHISYLLEGKPAVVPTLQWREEDRVYWHGSTASQALRAAENSETCLNVTLFDGLVLARSAFHHSANYRSATIFGIAEPILDFDLKLEKLKNFFDGLYPGRWDTLRPIMDKEVRATSVLSLRIEEASAKIRSGHPVDDEEDYAVAVWAGMVPLENRFGTPISDPRNIDGVAVPSYASDRAIG